MSSKPQIGFDRRAKPAFSIGDFFRQNVGPVLTVASLIGGGWFAIEKRLVVVEERQANQAKVDATQDARLSEALLRLNESLLRLDRQIDRLTDKIDQKGRQ